MGREAPVRRAAATFDAKIIIARTHIPHPWHPTSSVELEVAAWKTSSTVLVTKRSSYSKRCRGDEENVEQKRSGPHCHMASVFRIVSLEWLDHGGLSLSKASS